MISVNPPVFAVERRLAWLPSLSFMEHDNKYNKNEECQQSLFDSKTEKIAELYHRRPSFAKRSLSSKKAKSAREFGE